MYSPIWLFHEIFDYLVSAQKSLKKSVFLNEFLKYNNLIISGTFPQENHTIFTVMMGGAWFNQLFGSNPSLAELDSIGLKHLKSILKIKEDPVSKVIKLHRNCIAQYTRRCPSSKYENEF